MSATPLSSNDISQLIDYLLKSKDPANVGLRKILKMKKDKDEAYPLRPASFEEFYVEGKTAESYDKNERIIIELEKQLNDLRSRRQADQKEAAAQTQQAYEKGLADGFKNGEAAARDKAKSDYAVKLNELQKKLHEVCVGLETSKNAVYSGASDILLALCFETVKKLINTEVHTNPDIILSVLQKALSYIADKDRIIIKVAKDDLETVSGRKDFWMPVGEHLKSITIETDERITKGGCIVESNSGLADARLGVGFDDLKEIVEKAWASINPYNQPAAAPTPGERP
jgi:flagellar biosynthesis/type III secretory pathway protein FliH